MRIHKGNHNGEYKGKDQNEVTVAQVPKHRSKKDTKRWCLGKVGREHDLHKVPKTSSYDPDVVLWWTNTCKKCKKQFMLWFKTK